MAKEFRNRLEIESRCEIEAGVPIIPVSIGDDRTTVDVSEELAEAGYFVPAIRPPTVPEGTARLRVSLSAAHDESMVGALADQISRLAIG